MMRLSSNDVSYVRIFQDKEIDGLILGEFRMKKLRGWVVGFLSGTLLFLPGCSGPLNGSADNTGPSIDNRSSPQAPHTSTYAIQDTSHLPQKVLTDLTSKSTVPVMVPHSLPRFSAPPSSGDGLAVDADVSADGYDLTFFWRPLGSQTSEYNLSDLIGYISASRNARVEPFVPTQIELEQGKVVHLPNGVAAVQYPELGQSNRSVITWNDLNWTYLAYGYPSSEQPYDLTSVSMADSISKDIRSHGVILPNVKQGYVQATLLNNHPFVVISWTYDNEVWYSISLQNLNESLKAARSTQVFKG